MSDLSVRRPTAPTLLRRLLTVLVVVLSATGLLATPAAAEARQQRLTPAQERVVLRLIDDICGDTWCEGDHDFRFRSLSCLPAAHACVLVVQIASWSEEPRRWRWRAGAVRGFPRYRDMVMTGADGERALRPAFYSAVGNTVRALEATVP